MFTQAWKIYLPAVAILLKRSTNGDQVISMNSTDFLRATGGKKIKYGFDNMRLKKGRINTEVKQTHLGEELAILLREHELTKKIISENHFEFAMKDFQLFIKNINPLPIELENTSSKENDEFGNSETIKSGVKEAVI